MSGESAPSSRRFSPPPRLLTAFTNHDSSSEHVIVLDLLDETEASLAAGALKNRSWRVVNGWDLGDLVLTAVVEDHPQIVLTDDPALPNSLPEPWDTNRPLVVVVVDERESAIEGAWSAGADWVICRPIDPVDPLGI